MFGKSAERAVTKIAEPVCFWGAHMVLNDYSFVLIKLIIIYFFPTIIINILDIHKIKILFWYSVSV